MMLHECLQASLDHQFKCWIILVVHLLILYSKFVLLIRDVEGLHTTYMLAQTNKQMCVHVSNRSAFSALLHVCIIPPRLIRVDFAVELDAPLGACRLAPRVYLACAGFLRISIHASHSGIPRPKHSRPFSPKRRSVIILILAGCKTADAGVPPT